jgi:hypothetical protein
MRPPLHAAACALAVSAAAPAQDSAQPRVQAWHEDIDYLAAELGKRHVAPFATTTEAAFRAAAAALEARVPDVDDDHVRAGLMQLVASIGDSHTVVQPPELLAESLPLRLVYWPDGLRVFATLAEHRHLLGQRVESVAGKGVAEVLQKLDSVIASGTEPKRRLTLPHLMTRPRLLAALDLIENAGAVPMRFVDDAGGTTDVELAPADLGAGAVFAPTRGQVVTGQRGAKWHHMEWLPEPGLLYVQFNRCATSEQHDLDRFTGALEDVLRQNEVRAVAIDVQYNGGGSSALGDALFARLARHDPMRAKKNVFCIIGGSTFSSAILNALSLRDRYGAVLVGSPTGGTASHYGEVRTFSLPNSKLTVQHSTKHFVRGDGRHESIQPDHVVERTYADYVAGRDPVLDKVLSLIAR